MNPSDPGEAGLPATLTLTVSGMTCGHCVAAVSQELKLVACVTDVRIDLIPGGASTVTVTTTRQPSLWEIAAAIDEAGYELLDPKP